MKRILQLIVCLSFLCSVKSFSQSENNKETIYYFIRHAEKQRGNAVGQNPHLSEKGLERAKSWRDYFKEVKFDAIYSTDYYRTIETAQPIAEADDLTIKTYNSNNLYTDTFRYNTQGKTVLVVGHSNTTPAFVNTIIGKDFYEPIADNNNSNLYVVEIVSGVVNHRLTRVE